MSKFKESNIAAAHVLAYPKSYTPVDQLSARLRFHRVTDGYTISEPLEGTYGYVWILIPDNDSLISPTTKIALKTVMPKLNSDNSKLREDLKVFEREMTLSLSLPASFFALKPLGLLQFGLPLEIEDETFSLPVLKMKAMDGSLEEWVGKQTAVTIENKLIAVVQGLCGLRHMYRNGFEGHGDIKPSNFLYLDMRKGYPHIRESDLSAWPSNKYPYRVVIADFGWADAWVDLGYSNKVLRWYMAPERIHEKTVPIKSDIFSIGILISELCQGKNPANNFNKAKKSNGNWEKCVKNEDWDLSNIPTDNIKDIVFSCLSFDPANRPDINELIDKLSKELEKNFGIHHFQKMLSLYDKELTEDKIDSLPWSSLETAPISEREKNRTIAMIKTEINNINVIDCDSYDRWLRLAETAIKIINPVNDPFILGLRKASRNYLDNILDKVTKHNLHDSIPSRLMAFDSLRKFEVFSAIVAMAVKIAESNYENEISNNKSAFMLSALAFDLASWSISKVQDGETTDKEDFEIAEYYFTEAINHNADQAVLFYFSVSLKLKFFRERLGISDNTFKFLRGSQVEQVEKLKLAIKYDSEWKEPKKLLREIEEFSWDGLTEQTRNVVDKKNSEN